MLALYCVFEAISTPNLVLLRMLLHFLNLGSPLLFRCHGMASLKQAIVSRN